MGGYGCGVTKAGCAKIRGNLEIRAIRYFHSLPLTSLYFTFHIGDNAISHILSKIKDPSFKATPLKSVQPPHLTHTPFPYISPFVLVTAQPTSPYYSSTPPIPPLPSKSAQPSSPLNHPDIEDFTPPLQIRATLHHFIPTTPTTSTFILQPLSTPIEYPRIDQIGNGKYTKK